MGTRSLNLDWAPGLLPCALAETGAQHGRLALMLPSSPASHGPHQNRYASGQRKKALLILPKESSREFQLKEKKKKGRETRVGNSTAKAVSKCCPASSLLVCSALLPGVSSTLTGAWEPQVSWLRGLQDCRRLTVLPILILIFRCNQGLYYFAACPCCFGGFLPKLACQGVGEAWQVVGGKQWEPSAEGRWDQVVLGRAVSSE